MENTSNTPTYPLPIVTSIGEEKVTFHVRKTRATPSYDGFGTITIFQFDGFPDDKNSYFRLVLIRDEHLAWQEGRYASGWVSAEKPDEAEYNECIERLRRQMWDKEAYEPRATV